jgi:putative glutamine amidotransferase
MTVIAITTGPTERPEVVSAFTASVLAAGGIPLLLPTALGASPSVDEALGRVDGLLLSGGGDVHPSEYGESVRSTLDAVDRQRDRMELSAFHAAHRAGKRVLGVCRGAQLMAVATGGSLIQDLTAEGYHGHVDESHDRGYATLRHGIKADVGSVAEEVLSSLGEVNSHHHQAIREVGTLLTATAWAHDGVIEAVEAPGLLGVQWHPEALIACDERHLEPFRWLIHGNQPEGSK